MLLCAPGFTVLMTLSSLAGITAYAYFAAKGCDPLYTKEITNANQVIRTLARSISLYLIVT